MKNNQLNNQNKVCNYIICFDKKHMNTGFQIQISTIVKKCFLTFTSNELLELIIRHSKFR